MAFKVQVGHPQIAIHQGQTVLVTDPDGTITWPSEKGLYFLDTRIISNWAIYANGEPWQLLNGGPIDYYAARIFLTNKSILTEEGEIPLRTLGLTISRSFSGGLHEDLDITNNSIKLVRFQLEVAFRCDFADIFEVKSGRIVRRGKITTEWSDQRQQVRTVYSNRDFRRAVTTSVVRAPCKAVSANGGLSFEVVLQPNEIWHACLLYGRASRYHCRECGTGDQFGVYPERSRVHSNKSGSKGKATRQALVLMRLVHGYGHNSLIPRRRNCD